MVKKWYDGRDLEAFQEGLTISADPFAALRAKFVLRCREELAVLRDSIGNEPAGAEAANREALARIAHSLAGAGGTFGFAELSELASRLENLLAVDADVSDAECRAAANALAAELERVSNA